MSEYITFEQYIENKVSEYKEFMGIVSFPEYTLVTKEIMLDKALKSGFDSLANAKYDFDTRKNVLTVATHLMMPKTDHIIFHELTHILDEEAYCKDDKIRYMANAGYTEYHASQVELMKLTGATSISASHRFSMEDRVITFGVSESVRKYISRPYNGAIEILHRTDFPADIEALKATIGMLFNFWGYQSICRLYATDFNDQIDDNADMTDFSELFLKAGDDPVMRWRKLLDGWLNFSQVRLVDQLYMCEVFSLIKKFNLT